MLEIRKNTFSKNYENSFFREFSRHLYNSFKTKKLSGVLIGSPLCEVDDRLQIDALLITPNVVCIIDFKNFRGKIKLPAEKDFEFGLWTTETGEQIKGGSSINPFIQLKNQKRRFTEVSDKHIKRSIASPDTFNPFHLVRVVCFQEEVEIVGKIPDKEALNFFILDKQNFIEKILDIVDVTDKEVNLSSSSFDAFKNVFRADQFKFDEKPLEDKLKDVASKSTKLDYGKLHDDQKAALTEIKSFLENSEQQVFILQGTINSGKSYLIPFIQELAYNSAIQETEIFAASSRVAKNLFSSSGLERVNSIYSFIYGGLKTEAEEKEEAQEEIQIETEEQEVSDELPLEVVPMKKCDNSENALFIVDESQLVSDSYHQSIDLVFGTGYLLKDFLTFTDLKLSKRKVVFLGDPYQLQLGKTEESPLNPSYLEETYNLKVVCFQLLDKGNFSDINNQALNCVQSIRENIFNSLRFVAGNQISILSNDDKLPCVTNLIENNIDGHILSFSNEEAQKVNYWIKKSIIKTGEDIASKDLVLFNNNISVEDESDPFAEPKKIFNGQFATVLNVSKNIIPETIKIKGEPTTINFRELTLQLNETGHQIKVLGLENYRLNPKAELSKNEIIAFKVILNTQLYRYIKENPFEKSSEYREVISSSNYQAIQKEIEELKQKLAAGEKVKGKLEEKEIEGRKLLRKAKKKHKLKIESALRKDPSTKYYKYKNAALLRFGWAMTVHKSMSYKWQEVLFNVDPGETVGKTNANHFRWLYTGISRARQKVNLINFKPISPFDQTEFRDQNTGVRPQDIFFHSDNANPTLRLEELKEFVSTKLSGHQFTVRNVEHFNYQERYFIRNGNNQEAVISFSYNGQGNFRLPSIIGGDNNTSARVVESLRVKAAMNSFTDVKDSWRRKEYEKLKVALTVFEINFELILQTNWKDKIRFFSGANELEIELDFGGDGLVSFITAKYYSDKTIWENFQTSIEQIKQ
jgi:hypothetical protein